MNHPQPRSSPVLLLIFISGAAGLVYQVAWIRQLQPAMGGSVYAITAVLASFMAGLAAGSAVISRVAPRLKRPLAVYALLELFIAVWGLLSPVLLSLAGPALAAYHPTSVGGASDPALAAWRFLLAFLLLLPPTFAMGATLPAVARACGPRHDNVGRLVGRLYAASSAGAVCGALGAGFLILPALGLAGGCRLAALGNLAAAAGAWLLGRRRGQLLGSAGRAEVLQAARQDILVRSPGLRPFFTIHLAALLSGAASMALEVAWSRNFAMLFGSSVYAISLVLAAFIGGIALGAFVPSRYFDRWGASRVPAAAALALAAVLTALVAACGSLLPLVSLRLFWWSGGAPALAYPLQLLLAGLILLPGTFCTGAAFPLLVRSLSAAGGRPPEQALGSLYAVNTAGAVAGIVTAGFFVLPALGIEKTSLAGSMVLSLAAAVLLLGGRRRWWQPLLPLGLCGLAALPALLRPWDQDLVTSGPFVYAGIYREIAAFGREWDPERDDGGEGRSWTAGTADTGSGGAAPLPGFQGLRELVRARGELIWHRQGANASVAVRRSREGTLSLQINGKTDASTGGDMKLQLLSAHLPLLLHPDPSEVFLLGLASGVSLGAVLEHPEVRHVTCAEISPAVVEASRFFDRFSGAPLDDPRVELAVEDGRSVLARSPAGSMDVIISEPSNPWIAGMADLFSLEFFQLCRSRLAGGGLCCQWVQSYSLETGDLRRVAATFGAVFPRATLWAEKAAGGDYLLIGFADDPGVRVTGRDDLQRRMANPHLTWWEGMGGPPAPLRLLGHLACDAAGLAGFCDGAPLITDDNISLEFSAPLALHRRTLAGNIAALLPHRADRGHLPPWLPLDGDAEADALAALLTSQAELEMSCLAALELDLETAVLRLEASLAASPENPEAREFLFAVAPAFCSRLTAAGQPAGALILCRLYLVRRPGSAVMLMEEGRALTALGLHEEAAARFRRVAAASPGDGSLANSLGMALHRSGDVQGAVEAFTEAARLAPGLADAPANLGAVLLESGEAEQAERHLRRALELDPAHPSACNNLAVLLRRGGRVEEAVRLYRRAIEAAPGRPEFRLNLGALLESTGDQDGALELYQAVLDLDPGNGEALARLKEIGEP
jgi:spermidine synthase